MMVGTLPVTLARLVSLIEEANQNGVELSPSRIRDLVLEAEVDVKDLEPYADYDHPIEDCYGRKMVYDGGFFEVMVMTWNPGDFSSIHNHGYTQWGAVQVFGHAQHYIYRLQKNRLDFARKEILTRGSVVKVNNALIHQMGNSSSDPYLTLHIYGNCELPKDVTADARNYDLEFDRISHTTGGAFFNLPEEEIYDYQPGPEPSQEVYLNYARLLMDYYNRQDQTPRILQLKSKLLQQMRERLVLREEMN